VIAGFGTHVTACYQENRGAAAARNQGLRLSSREFVKFLDADDLLLPDAIASQTRDALTIPSGQNAVVFGDVGHMEADGSNRRARRYAGRAVDENDLEQSILQLLDAPISTLAPLHRRRTLLTVGGFDETLRRWDDYEFHLRLRLHGVGFWYRPTLVAYARIHEAEQRLSNTLPWRDEPSYQFNVLEDRIRQCEEQLGRPLPPSLRQYLARSFWGNGRRVLRYGHTKEAARYFAAARELADKHFIRGPLPYRFVARLFGWRVAEALIRRTRAAVPKWRAASQ